MNPLVLIVLDGFGIRAAREHNAIALARKPVYDGLLERYPHAQLVVADRLVDPGQVLVDDAPRAHVGVADLGVAHLPGWQADGLA